MTSRDRRCEEGTRAARVPRVVRPGVVARFPENRSTFHVEAALLLTASLVPLGGVPALTAGALLPPLVLTLPSDSATGVRIGRRFISNGPAFSFPRPTSVGCVRRFDLP